MAWFVAQVWVLCAVAFLLGAAVTWVLFVRPQRAPLPRAAPAPASVEPVVGRVEPQPVAEDAVVSPTLPALAALDTPPLGVPRGTGVRAVGALDLLGVTPAGPPPAIPTQPGPPDDDPQTRTGRPG